MKDKAVLFVDDEEHILKALSRLLRQEEYTLFTAGSGEDGLDILEGNTVQLVVSDQRMPGMTGIEFLQKVKDLYPDTVRVVLSGYAEVAMIVESINQGEIYRFLAKPWNDEELKTIFRQCLEHYDIVLQNRLLMEQTRVQNEELRRLNEGLEEVVAERTHFLRLSQDILDNLPVAVAGISKEGLVVLANQAASNLLNNLALGMEMHMVFPSDISGPVRDLLNNGVNHDDLKVISDSSNVTVHVRVLRHEEGELRGCLMLISTE